LISIKAGSLVIANNWPDETRERRVFGATAAEDRIMEWTQPAWWVAAWQIIVINIVLSGDNAVVIALACRTLPAKQRLWGMVFGAGAAVLLRIIFVLIVTAIMDFPLLKFVGGILLLWIAIKLVADSRGEVSVEAADNLWRAVKIVAIADVVMSLDNVIAIAAAAKGSWVLIIFGLAVTVPLIVAGSVILVALLDRLPILAWAGAALLGWIAGDIMVEDPGLTYIAAGAAEPFAQVVQYAGVGLGEPLTSASQDLAAGLAEPFTHTSRYLAAGLGAMFVVATGYILVRRRRPVRPSSSPRHEPPSRDKSFTALPNASAGVLRRRIP
jgi:YjbE family integral membrane protein